METKTNLKTKWNASTIKKLKRCFLLLGVLALTACGKSKKDTTPNLLTTNTNTNGYYFVGGYCYLGNQVVNSSFCQQVGNVMPGAVNPYGNQQQLTNPYGYGNGYGNQIQAQQCLGTYLTSYNQYVQCTGANCSGQTLYNVQTGASTYCY